MLLSRGRFMRTAADIQQMFAALRDSDCGSSTRGRWAGSATCSRGDGIEASLARLNRRASRGLTSEAALQSIGWRKGSLVGLLLIVLFAFRVRVVDWAWSVYRVRAEQVDGSELGHRRRPRIRRFRRRSSRLGCRRRHSENDRRWSALDTGASATRPGELDRLHGSLPWICGGWFRHRCQHGHCS